jgi:putative phage-type endonuclease
MGIGGSDAAAAVNLSRWKSPYRLWQEKIGVPTVDDVLADKEQIRFGELLEDIVAREFARRRGVRVQRERQTLRHRDYPFMLAHIDRRIIGSREGLECKTASLRMARDWGEEDTDEIPVEYLAQAAHYLAVTGYVVWHVAVLIAGNDYRMYRIERDAELIEALIERERAFWAHVESRTPPEPTTLDDAFARWPQDTGETRLVTPEIAADVTQLKEYRRTARSLKAQMESCELRIKNFIGGATGLNDEAGRTLLTWKTQSAARVDVKALREKFPDIASAVTQSSQSRVLRLM